MWLSWFAQFFAHAGVRVPVAPEKTTTLSRQLPFAVDLHTLKMIKHGFTAIFHFPSSWATPLCKTTGKA
jgi:hypothetical protein